MKHAWTLLLILCLLTGCSTQQPSPTPEKPETPSEMVPPEKKPEESHETSFAFADLDGLEFTYSSGAGAWITSFRIYPDGSFTGTFHDWNADPGPEHPDGTTNCNDFSGTLAPVKAVNDHTVSTQIETIHYTNDVGTEVIRDNMRYCYTEATGFESEILGEVQIFLPGAPVEQLPENFRYWVNLMQEGAEDMTLDTYGIFNVQGEIGGLGADPLPTAREQVQAILDAAETTDADLQNRLQNDGSLSQADMNEIAHERFVTWDQALNAIWQVLDRVLPPADMETLTKEELDWIKAKEAAVQEAAEDVAGGSLAPLTANSTAADWTRNRVHTLANHLG